MKPRKPMYFSLPLSRMNGVRQVLLRLWPVALALATATSAGASGPAVPLEAVDTAQKSLSDSLRDPDQLGILLLGLRATRDRELQPLYLALLRSRDRQTRLTATAMVGEIGDETILEGLRERLYHDPAMAVRAEAMVQLLRRNGLTTAQLQEALAIDDDGVRMLAAWALIQRGKGTAAIATLQAMLHSPDAETVAQARLSLFGLGVDAPRHQAELKKLLLDPKTSDELLQRLLSQIRRENIRAAVEVAQFLTNPQRSRTVRVEAYMALADLAPDASRQMAQVLAAPEESDLFRLNLLRILAEQPDAKYWLEDLARRDDLAGLVARFEQARLVGEGDLAALVTTMVVQQGHPMLLEYVLNRLRRDAKENKTKAEAYVEPLLAALRTAELSEDRLTAQHDRMAAAVEELANLGSPRAMAGLRELLSGPNNAVRKLTAGALYRSTNPAVCDLVLPLLQSPYADHRIYAAMTLARHGRSEAIPALLEIQANARTHRPDVLILANWYLLKLAGQSQPAVELLVRTVR